MLGEMLGETLGLRDGLIDDDTLGLIEGDIDALGD